MTNEFIIKIHKDSKGNELSLDNITIEAADALKVFLESLTDFAKLYASSNIKLSLKNGSIESCLSYSSVGNSMYDEINKVIIGESKSISNEKIKILKTIQDKIKQNGLDYSVIHKVNDEYLDITSTFKSKNFPFSRAIRHEISEDVEFIKGRLYESGGKVKTNIHLECEDGEYKVECSQKQAIEVNDRLYSEIYLSVLKRWKIGQKATYHLLDNYLAQDLFLIYKNFFEAVENDESLNKYDIVYDKIIEIIESGRNIREVLKVMRLYNYSQSNRGILRTILMTLKPYSKNEDLSKMYNSLAQILRAGSSNNAI